MEKSIVFQMALILASLSQVALGQYGIIFHSCRGQVTLDKECNRGEIPKVYPGRNCTDADWGFAETLPLVYEPCSDPDVPDNENVSSIFPIHKISIYLVQFNKK